MSHRNTILVVDDSQINRKLLCKILESNYNMIQAKNGQEALEVLKAHSEEISLVLLDIIMPVMNGYEFLDAIKTDVSFSGVPVIVTTSQDNESDEIKCLANGASDFVLKPYHPEVVRHRVASIIRLRESSAMLNMLEYDQLTGLYSKEFFYQHVARKLEKYPDKQFDIICSDVESFKLVNERYGVHKGDELLCYIAKEFQKKMKSHGICARLNADVFALLIEHSGKYNDGIFEMSVEAANKAVPVPNIIIKFGIYENVDRSLPPSGMCDRAILALERIKKQYGKIFASYDDSLRLALLKEQQILDCMEQALAQKQFEVYYQPKHDIKTGRVAGAEALVRWRHPEFGLMPPGDFIPLFEKNGFITKLDFYVCEEVCKMLQGWKKEGIPLVPISFNLSRIDFTTPHLAEVLEKRADQYGIDHGLLHVEVTESVYTENPQQIIEVLEALRTMDFKIEMDDFGSGYSSLNMLSDLPIHILKLDMGFMKRQGSSQKESILDFIVSLAKWMGLETVAEGVETVKQVDELRNMGCNYVQGYVFAKPMPGKEFKEYFLKDSTAPMQEPEKPEIPKEPEIQTKPTVLIVEDVELNRRVLCSMLSPYYQVEQAANGKEAYDYLLKHGDGVSAILLDLMMPVMNGFQFLDMIRNKPNLSQIPVIITSENGERSEVQALRLGAYSFAAKPYEQEILLHHLKNASDSQELRRIKDKLEQSQTKLAMEAYRDSLTGLLNRRGLSEALEQIGEGRHAVFMLDIDNLKSCNDTYGHDCGDKLLEMAAETLVSDTRDGDILARVGGDEFVLVMKNLSSHDLALKKGDRICEDIKANELPDYQCQSSCSIGVSIMSDTAHFEEIRNQADRALYRAKRENKGGCCIWEEIE